MHNNKINVSVQIYVIIRLIIENIHGFIEFLIYNLGINLRFQKL